MRQKIVNSPPAAPEFGLSTAYNKKNVSFEFDEFFSGVDVCWNEDATSKLPITGPLIGDGDSRVVDR